MNFKSIFCLIISVVLCNYLVAQADSIAIFQKDTTRNAIPFVVYRNLAVEIDTFSFRNQVLSLGGVFKIKGTTFSIALPMINRSQLTNNNNTRAVGLNMSILGNRYAVHLFGRYFDSFPNGLLSLPFRIREPLIYANLRGNYIFSKEFDYQSSFSLLSSASRSGGGFVISPDVFYYFASPNLNVETVPNHLLQTRLNVGYAYHYLINKKYFISGQLDTGYGLELDVANSSETIIDHQYFPFSNIKIALGHQTEHISWLIMSEYTPNRLTRGRATSSNFYLHLTVKIAL